MTLSVVEQVYPETLGISRFRIVETYESCDGTRTRMTHRSFVNKEKAILFCTNPEKFPEEGEDS